MNGHLCDAKVLRDRQNLNEFMYAWFGSFVVVHVAAGVLPRPSKAKTSSVVQNKNKKQQQNRQRQQQQQQQQQQPFYPLRHRVFFPAR